MPVTVTAVQPPADQSSVAAAEPIAPPMKLPVTNAVFRRLRAAGATANIRTWLRTFRVCTATSRATTATRISTTAWPPSPAIR